MLRAWHKESYVLCFLHCIRSKEYSVGGLKDFSCLLVSFSIWDTYIAVRGLLGGHEHDICNGILYIHTYILARHHRPIEGQKKNRSIEKKIDQHGGPSPRIILLPATTSSNSGRLHVGRRGGSYRLGLSGDLRQQQVPRGGPQVLGVRDGRRRPGRPVVGADDLAGAQRDGAHGQHARLGQRALRPGPLDRGGLLRRRVPGQGHLAQDLRGETARGRGRGDRTWWCRGFYGTSSPARWRWETLRWTSTWGCTGRCSSARPRLEGVFPGAGSLGTTSDLSDLAS